MGGGSDYALNPVANTRIGEDGAGSITWNVACQIDEVDWVKTVQAIISVDCLSGAHSPGSESFQLRWRNLTDAGSFATLTTSGELRRGISAGAINNTDPVGDPQNCPSGTIDASEEVENESPLQSASLSASQNDLIETQWCGDMSNALDGKEYEFDLYSQTEGASVGVCTPTITIFEEAPAEADEKISKLNENLNGPINNGLN